jgi:hypothetical protein
MTPVMQRPCVCPRCGVGHSGVRHEPPAEAQALLAQADVVLRSIEDDQNLDFVVAFARSVQQLLKKVETPHAV